MTRILFIITGLGTGGAEAMLVKVLTRLDRSRFDVRVVSLSDPGSHGATIEAMGIPLLCLGMRRGMPSWRAWRSLLQLAKDWQPQILQGWMYHGNLAVSLLQKALSRQVPVIWNIRQTLYDVQNERWMTRLIIRAGRWMSKGTHTVLYNSQTSLGQHNAFGYEAARARVIPNGFDTQVFRPDAAPRKQLRGRLGLADGDLCIGMAARWHPQKDFPTLMRAAELLWAKRPDAVLMLAGKDVDGDNPQLQEWMQRAPAGRLHLLGEQKDMAGFHAALDVATLSSAWGDAFPNAIGEAMSCGVPCVVTAIGDTPDIVGDSGRVVPPSDPSALAAGWLALLDAPPAERQRLGQAARARIIQHYSIEAVVDQYMALYERCHGACA